MSFKKIWHFIWKDNSLLSWIVNLILAFILVKFIIYPALGLLLQTSFPVVAVVSNSMIHTQNFDNWWESNKEYYQDRKINKEEFEQYSFHNGFNKGDIMILQGAKTYNKGDILVYSTPTYNYPIIHRIIDTDPLITKGDNNKVEDPISISQEQIQGKAIVKVPLLGWIKIWFTDLIRLFIGG